MTVTLGVNSLGQDCLYAAPCKTHAEVTCLKISCPPRTQSPGSILPFLKDAPLSWILRAAASCWQLGLERIQWPMNPWTPLLQQWESEGQNSHTYALPHSHHHIYNFPRSDTHWPPPSHFKKKVPHQPIRNLFRTTQWANGRSTAGILASWIIILGSPITLCSY